MKSNNGKVYIVGAGPGDPELISVKGLNVLKRADCVLYDFLSAPELLEHAKESAEKICVGKADGLHLKEQDETNSLLYEKSLIHKTVVRLKGGDPFIFSRGSEEAKYLREKKVDHEVIPGITSAIAGPESFGIPLTIKNKIQSVAIVTGRKKDKNAEIDAPDAGTLVYLMAVANIKNVVKALKKSGRKENIPCAFIEKATRKDTRIVRGTIGTIEEKVKKEKVKPPAVLVVGEAVGCEEK
ncbi:MAG: uroporphyrinogen-III C-methyltransferase [Candidatus Omnitrophica bacterium]|nr:uroporphyrinogen-III C-methyltransferase [Candidatus Omnitrophota bacterium]